MIKVIPFIYDDSDDLYANTYIVIDENNKCVIIDPSSTKDGVVNYIKNNGLLPQVILLTHAHADHIRGVDTIRKTYPLPVYIGFEDMYSLYDPYENCSEMLGENISLNCRVNAMGGNITINALSEPIKMIETPYHTKGSVCYYLPESNILFSGDSLFKGGIGRDDLPTSLRSKKKESLEKILSLPENTKVYPGHGGFTTIGEEKRDF